MHNQKNWEKEEKSKKREKKLGSKLKKEYPNKQRKEKDTRRFKRANYQRGAEW